MSMLAASPEAISAAVIARRREGEGFIHRRSAAARGSPAGSRQLTALAGGFRSEASPTQGAHRRMPPLAVTRISSGRSCAAFSTLEPTFTWAIGLAEQEAVVQPVGVKVTVVASGPVVPVVLTVALSDPSEPERVWMVATVPQPRGGLISFTVQPLPGPSTNCVCAFRRTASERASCRPS